MAHQLSSAEFGRPACGSCGRLALGVRVNDHSTDTFSSNARLLGRPCFERNVGSGRSCPSRERNARSARLMLCSATSVFASIVGFRSRRIRKHSRHCTQQQSLELYQNLRESVQAEDDADLLRYGDWCAFVVNLARRPDRLKKFKDVYAARAPLISDRLERIDAVDGKELSFDDERMSSWLEPGTLAKAKRARELKLCTVVHDENNLLVHFDDHFTEGAVACALSHLEALRRIATHPTASWGLIFEDDVSQVVPDVEKSIALILKKLPADWDAVYLGYHHDDGKPHPAAVDPRLADTCAVDVPILPVSTHVWGLFALMIRKEAAEALVQKLFPLRTQVDGAISSWLVRNGHRVFQVPPEQLLFYSSCSEEAQDTDIQTMKSDTAVAEEYGSVQEYLKIQKQAGVDPYSQNLMRILMAQYTRSWTASSYSLVGSFNDWTIDTESPDGVIHVGSDASPVSGSDSLCREEFQIVGDGQWEKRVFPDGGSGDKAVILVQPGKPSPAAEGDGEAGRGHGRNWAVDGPPGSSFRISYDPEAMTVMCERL